MPVYVYQCPDCGSQKEVVRGIKEPEEPPECLTGELVDDPTDCKKRKMERVITPASFILKGSGWAKDGYKK